MHFSMVGLAIRHSSVLQVGTGKGYADDDDDLEVCVTEFSLRCPLSGSRIRTPARFAGVGGLTAFDLDTFLGMVKRSKKWQCPHSMRNLPVQDLMIDGYLSRILPRLQVHRLLTSIGMMYSGYILCAAEPLAPCSHSSNACGN